MKTPSPLPVCNRFSVSLNSPSYSLHLSPYDPTSSIGCKPLSVSSLTSRALLSPSLPTNSNYTKMPLLCKYRSYVSISHRHSRYLSSSLLYACRSTSIFASGSLSYSPRNHRLNTFRMYHSHSSTSGRAFSAATSFSPSLPGQTSILESPPVHTSL